MTPSIGPFSGPVPSDVMKKVGAVVPKLQIVDIRLVTLNCQLKGSPEPDRSVTVELSNEVKSDPIADNLLGVHVRFILSAKSDVEQGEEFLAFSASFQLTYEGENVRAIEEDRRMAFANVNAVHNAWPYLRELVQNMSGRMSIPPLTVPLLKVSMEASKRESSPTTATQ